MKTNELIDSGSFYEIADYKPIVDRDDNGNIISIINCPYIPKLNIKEDNGMSDTEVVNIDACKYMHKGIAFYASSEFIRDVYDIHKIDVVEKIKMDIDSAIRGFKVETIVDLENKTAKLIITKTN